MEKTLIITPSRCTACKTCELACSFKYAVAGRPGIPRIRSFMIGEGRNQILTCFQCDEAACVKVCPVEALRRNETTEAIEVDARRCIGCGLCSITCPFGHISHDGHQNIAVKCDLCGGDPACAIFCPTQTLEYRGIDEPSERRTAPSLGERPPAGAGFAGPGPTGPGPETR
jgi:Fe-S-cluster-containing hydrogenase component 2